MSNSVPPTRPEPEKTGKFLVLFAEGTTQKGADLLKDKGGLDVFMKSEIGASDVNSNVDKNQALVYDKLGVAVVNAEADQLTAISSADVSGGFNSILTIEPERILTAAETTPPDNLTIDELTATWGLSATKVIDSKYSGRRIKVAILDTGIDLNHPDFTNRKIISQSFVPDQEVQDLHGHGTHCTGVACGPRQPSQNPRYGIAYDADIYIGKVLNNEKASGTDGMIIAGIEWALNNGCHIISMSISGRSIVGTPFSQIYEIVARRVLNNGSLIIAAAGNDSWRNAITGPIFNPVGIPANCPSIMAVGAIDSKFQIAWFSNRGMSADSGKVNMVAPGVDVYSSWTLPTKYKNDDGTSMATPYVAGIAALFAEAKPEARGKALWDLLTQNARSLPLPKEDVGVGLVQAP